ncbi:hypothetical protein LTR66_012158 [Elasticomyces elasticus]|nr:hypothetical protein LTR66_012158 [Elasticomyces elasticus]
MTFFQSNRKPICHEDVFRYTNGHFLIDEKFQYTSRYVKFNLDGLCDIAASVGSSKSPIRAIEKLEGGFSKALLMRREDGTELVAKIPCPNAGPALYTTASEVAVMQYVQTQTTVPVPKILAWSSDASNPVGTEYILMEKAPGIQLFRVWDRMDDSKKLTLIHNLTRLESQLVSLRFPASGNLYLRHSIPDKVKRKTLNSYIDPNLYCIGPSCDRSWLLEPSIETANLDLDKGPWSSLSAYGVALAKREISRIVRTPKQDPRPIPRGATSEQIFLLETTINLMKVLEAHPPLARSAQPMLWHTDLHMGNIFVSDEDPSQILSFIDWQSTSVLPMFLQVRWPVFLKPPKNYPTGFIKPKLPDDFDRLSFEDKEPAVYEWKQATRAKAYEVSSRINNEDSFHAMNLPRVFQEIFVRCGGTWEEGIVPLRACLIEIFQTWQELSLPGDCPFTFPDDEIRMHELELEKYREWHDVQEFAREYLDTDAEGWISPEIDFGKKREQNRALFELFLDKMAGGKPREVMRRLWPFSEDL